MNYTYVKLNTNIKTVYTIEYTTSKKVFDLLGSIDFDYSTLTTLKVDTLEEAINQYNRLYYNDKVLYITLTEQILLNNEIILEQSKDMTALNILPNEINRQLNNKDYEITALKKQIEKLNDFLTKHGINPDKI